ncbi:MAG TPA: hypothetical protein VFZ83_14315 [Acidimicrobiia bacterium]|nr:hypothetical protein [Acidimicrobiia bacterium]
MTDRRGAPAIVGSLDGSGTATVDAAGRVDCAGTELFLDWWIGGDDAWHIPSDEVGVRQHLLGVAPVVETTVRVSGGEAVQRVYGVAGSDAIAVEVENRSPTPFVVAFVLRPSAIGRKGEVALEGATVTVGGRPALVLPRPPQRWAVVEDLKGGVRDVVVSGRASEGAFVPVRSKRIVESAFLFPVAHRTTSRVALVVDARHAAALDPVALPDAETVRRGWDVMLERGARAVLPAPLTTALDAARAALLLAGRPHRSVSATTVAALEDWGFDAEAAAGWGALGMRARRTAARRDPSPTTAWARLQSYLAAASDAWAFPGGPAPFLGAVRDLLVHDRGDAVDLVPAFPQQWLGADVEVHDLPLRRGKLSFAIRWHGARPAMLWDAPAEVRLRAPTLDPAFDASGGAGEALLAEPEPSLLALGAPDPDRPGVDVDEPGDFR